MKKQNSLLFVLLSVFFLASCSQVVDKPDAKKAALAGVKEYCDNLAKEGTTFKIGEIESSVVQSNGAFIKIKVTVITNGKEVKKVASVGCERDSDKNWKVTSVSVE